MDEYIKNKKEIWEKTKLEPLIEKHPERFETFKTDSEIKIDTVYCGGGEGDQELPGDFPYTRGIQPNMYRGRLWTMRQYAGYSTAKESNKRYKYLLSIGTSGLSAAFDLPTQLGLDSDDNLSIGEVGKVGVAIDTLYDMEMLFDGIPLDKISTSMTINAPSIILLSMYLVAAKKKNIPYAKLRGTVQNDILKEYSARGTYIFPIKPSMRLINDIFEYCMINMPQWNTISISGYHIREAGADAVMEVAFTLADAIEYVRAAVLKGLNVDDFAPQISFFFSANNNLFEEVAKFRAARRMWAKIMKEKFNAKKEKSMTMRFHTQTAGSTLTRQQIDNNIIRVTIQTLAAVLGGTQSLHTNSKDEAVSLPAEDSVETALRTQQIAAFESGICDTADPLGGSYYIEYLTDEIEKRAYEYIEKIEEMGGAAVAVENGYIQNEIADSAYRYQMQIEKCQKIIVGVNKFQTDDVINSKAVVNDNVEEEQIKLLLKIKSERDNEKVKKALDVVKCAAGGSENLMPYIIDAVECYSTIGEICRVLKDVFGVYKENII